MSSFFLMCLFAGAYSCILFSKRMLLSTISGLICPAPTLPCQTVCVHPLLSIHPPPILPSYLAIHGHQPFFYLSARMRPSIQLSCHFSFMIPSPMPVALCSTASPFYINQCHCSAPTLPNRLVYLLYISFIPVSLVSPSLEVFVLL